VNPLVNERAARLAVDAAAIAASREALGLTASTPREVHERLLPLIGDDLDFARVLRVQLEAARVSIGDRAMRAQRP
jgi:hypothetical protein